jgi:hypothetical protein
VQASGSKNAGAALQPDAGTSFRLQPAADFVFAAPVDHRVRQASQARPRRSRYLTSRPRAHPADSTFARCSERQEQQIQRVHTAHSSPVKLPFRVPMDLRCVKCNHVLSKGSMAICKKEEVPSEQFQGLPLAKYRIRCDRCLHKIRLVSNTAGNHFRVHQGALEVQNGDGDLHAAQSPRNVSGPPSRKRPRGVLHADGSRFPEHGDERLDAKRSCIAGFEHPTGDETVTHRFLRSLREARTKFRLPTVRNSVSSVRPALASGSSEGEVSNPRAADPGKHDNVAAGAVLPSAPELPAVCEPAPTLDSMPMPFAAQPSGAVTNRQQTGHEQREQREQRHVRFSDKYGWGGFAGAANALPSGDDAPSEGHRLQRLAPPSLHHHSFHNAKVSENGAGPSSGRLPSGDDINKRHPGQHVRLFRGNAEAADAAHLAFSRWMDHCSTKAPVAARPGSNPGDIRNSTAQCRRMEEESDDDEDGPVMHAPLPEQVLMNMSPHANLTNTETITRPKAEHGLPLTTAGAEAAAAAARGVGSRRVSAEGPAASTADQVRVLPL